MADDLGNDWWKEDDDDSESPNKDDSEVEMEVETVKVEKQKATASGKKKKKKRKRKTITEELREIGEIAATSEDVVSFLKKQFDGKLSPVEWDEISLDSIPVPGDNITPPLYISTESCASLLQAEWQQGHFYNANSTGGYPVAYLKSILHKWKKLKSQPLSEGSPLLLVVSPSALRAVQLNRQIQDFKGENCRSAKLFAKHMKLEEQQKFLKKSICHIGVGTPNRVSALVKSGHLKLDKLLAVVLDWNWRDVKQHRLVDIPEVRAELASLLQTHIIPHIKSDYSSCKIGIL